MTIAFVHNNKAFLPELEAYVHFFSRQGISCEIVNTEELRLMHRQIEWRLMGTDFNKPREGILKIHEYTSSSVPPGRKWKNHFKSFFNAQPDFRIFLNAYVKDCYRFYDNIPYGFRDMGIEPSWLLPENRRSEKEFDFVYLGDVTRFREPQRLLDHFAVGAMQDRSLLILSNRYEELKEKYRAFDNIRFEGPVKHAEVNHWILKARFAINYILDKEPISRQTSTKMLEYAACGIPIVSTRYTWVNQFQKDYGGNYYFISDDLTDFTWEPLAGFEFREPDLGKWTWESRIRASGVLPFLSSRIEGIEF